MKINRSSGSYNLSLFKSSLALAITIIAFFLAACNQPSGNKQQTAKTTDTTVQKLDTTKKPDQAADNQNVLTLPVLDALFYDPGFAKSLRSQLGLSAVQVQKLKAAAHSSLSNLSEDGAVDTASASAANQRYVAQINTIIGDDKEQQLLQLLNDRYSKGVEGLAPSKPNFIPKDTRIVVNAPAFRMDVFQSGKLLKSYKVGIGYPEFPLPAGMRRADTIIFNPTWTPPDEPWVKGKFAPGRKVSASNDLNPLGHIKIPIGMPSLIHGGKPLEKIGNFASHGCVGLTNAQVQDFTGMLAQLGGSTLSADSISLLEKHHAKTYSVKLPKPVPVDLRYETIVAEGGSLHIYRDVYERGTNTLATAKRVLASYGVNYDKLSEQEQTDLGEALQEMNRDAHGKIISTDSIPPAKHGVPASKLERSKKGKVTYHIKGQKEAEVPIAALSGKGYPDPVDLDTGAPAKKKA